MIRRPPRSTLFPSTPLFRSGRLAEQRDVAGIAAELRDVVVDPLQRQLLVLEPLVAGVTLLADEIGVREEAEHAERSEEHTSELQSPCNLVCRLLLEKKNNEC